MHDKEIGRHAYRFLFNLNVSDQMKNLKFARHGMAAAILGLTALACMSPTSALADDKAAAAAPTDVLRPEILKPLSAAKILADGKNIPDALTKLAEADAVTDKTPYEVYAIERTRAQFYIDSGEKLKAAKAFEAALTSNYMQKKTDQLAMTEVIGQLYFQISDYPSTIKWMERFLSDGGSDPRAKDVLYKAYFLNKDYAKAYAGLDKFVQDQLAAGQVPDQQYFQILLNCMVNLNDDAGTMKALEQSNTYYPTFKNWDYLVSHIHMQPGFNDHLFLDVFRLKQELGLMKTAAEYADMTELATRAGLPAEAKKVLDQGFAAGLMDKGAEAKKYATLRTSVTKNADEDLKVMQQGEASASKAKDGAPLVNLGMAFATAGQFDKGATLIEQGLAKGVTTRAGEAKLHLGLVYYWAGRKEDAIKQLQTVQGNDGISIIARYWIMQINRPLAK